MDRPPEEPAVELAAKVSVTCCAAGAVHLNLFRADGAIFAGAAIGPDVADQLATMLMRGAASVRGAPAGVQ